MSEVANTFKVVIPAELSKSDDGEWVIHGLASTATKDRQGEIILPEGIDASPIDEGRGIINWDHMKGPEFTVGFLDGYKKTAEGFFVKGKLFKNHSKAKSVHEIMSSLNKSDKLKMGMSVEGKILQRSGKDGKVIKKCQINAVALTLNPVNQDSFADLVKSLSVDAEVDFQATEEHLNQMDAPTASPVFTADQVVQLIQKALGVSAGAANAPTARTNGDALTQEDLDSKPKKINEVKEKKLKKGTKDLYKSHMAEILDKISTLYPANSREEIWAVVKDRLSKKFPQLNENDV